MPNRRALLCLALVAPLAARAQTLAGGSPMRWIVPFTPGGAADAIGRNWASAYTAATGQTIVVENRSGGNGLIGVQAVREGAPDGSVLGVVNVSLLTALPSMMAKPPYDGLRDFTPIVRLVTSTVVCCVTRARAQEKGWTDFRKLIEWARKPGQQLTKGSAGNGCERSTLMPDVPGMGEFADLGLGDVDLQSWNALTGPAGMDPAVVDAIADGVKRAATPDLAARLKSVGMVLATTDSAAATRALMAADAPRWQEMARLSGAVIE